MTENANAARFDRLAGVGWIVFGALVLAESLRMERFESQGAELYVMPGFVPGLLGCTLMLLGLLHVLRGLRPAGSKAPAGNAAPERLLNGRAALTLVLSAGYAAGMVGHMPYALCTAIYVAVFVALFAAEGRSLGRRLLVGAGMGVATALAVTVVFQHLFLVRLP